MSCQVLRGLKRSLEVLTGFERSSEVLKSPEMSWEVLRDPERSRATSYKLGSLRPEKYVLRFT